MTRLIARNAKQAHAVVSLCNLEYPVIVKACESGHREIVDTPDELDEAVAAAILVSPRGTVELEGT